MARYRKESNLFKVFFGVVGALLLVGLGLYFFFLAENPPPFEKITLCPIDKAITRAHTAVILDRTEGLNDVQKQAMAAAIATRSRRSHGHADNAAQSCDRSDWYRCEKHR